jgi:lactate dehydrogenase-like 2-hydroxyacid dehydrogenase
MNVTALPDHVSGVPKTRGVVTAMDLARMRPTSMFVNISRGI